MRAVSTAVLFLCMTGMVNGSDFPFLPKGWRVPANRELRQEWRLENTNRFAKAMIDLNGDGVQDFAGIFVSKDNRRIGFFAFVSQKDGSFKQFDLDEKAYPYLEVLGVSPVGPGNYRTACGKGLVECDKGEAKVLPIATGAISYFKDDGAVAYYFWDKTTAAFRFATIED